MRTILTIVTLASIFLGMVFASFFSLVLAKAPVTAVDPSYAGYVTGEYSNVLTKFAKVNIRRTAGFAISAPETSPANSLEELTKGAIIGSVHFISTDLRSGARPGVYAVRVMRLRDGNWVARFLNFEGVTVGRDVPAQVQRSALVTTPVVSIEESKCWRFDRVRVCI